MLKKLQLEIETEHDLDDDQKSRVAMMVAGQGHIDHQGGFIDAAGVARTAVKIHFTSMAERALPSCCVVKRLLQDLG